MNENIKTGNEIYKEFMLPYPGISGIGNKKWVSLFWLREEIEKLNSPSCKAKCQKGSIKDSWYNHALQDVLSLLEEKK